ncbi:hypothetical protein BDQ12DRAFT_510594 [Crucibulum laeve]|uniref:Uncharacterized protein n=1 Tax=Crucibulum laeve TaxID=68775 RepID=A0A5C3M4J3_9AGAR|nr:hypothetical protein BDQ12DRAFT_510594 [Crucibulum laeve]
MATHIGSVFLGDLQRIRHLSTSTPPSSPPPTTPSSAYQGFPHSPPATIPEMPVPPPPGSSSSTQAARPPVIEPALALELRLRWLEAIILGVRQDGKDRKGKEKEVLQHGETLVRTAENVRHRLDSVVEGNEGLRKFMEHYDQNAHLLTPAFALSGTLPDPPTYENMSSEELEAFLTEMEPDIRAADRDMREIEALERKGVTDAGKLGDYEILKPRADKLFQAHHENIELAASLEKRIASLMERHANYVDALSELFVAWDDTLTEAEDKASKLERDRAERRRLGLES